MKHRTTLMLSVFLFSFGSTASAWADRKYVVTITPGPPPAFVVTKTGTACVGGSAKIQNDSGIAIHVKLTDANGTVLIDENVADTNPSTTATYKQAGNATLCVSVTGRGDAECGADEVNDVCGPGMPTVSAWGLIGLGVLLVAGGAVVFGRRRRVPGEC